MILYSVMEISSGCIQLMNANMGLSLKAED